MLTSIKHEVAQVAFTHHAFADAWRGRLACGRLPYDASTAASARHLCGRGLLLALLEVAGVPVVGARLHATASGRLLLPGSGWHVSISHAAGYTAAAIARTPVGLDIEMRNRRVDWLSIVEAMFPAETADRIREAPQGRRHGLFLEEWTRAEACAKLTNGLIVPLIAEDVSQRHAFFTTEELIGCVATGSRQRGYDV